MSAPAYLESLPYIDKPESDEALAAARALIASESSASSFSPRLPPDAPSPSFSPAIQAELARVASQTPLAPFDSSRYEAQDASSDGDDAASVLAKASTSLAYLGRRNCQLVVLERHGPNAWLLANHLVEQELRALEADLAATKGAIDQVNLQRASRQDAVRAEMQWLEEEWRTAVGTVLETEVAVGELKREIRRELEHRNRSATAAES